MPRPSTPSARIDRRRFLGIAGASAAALAGLPFRARAAETPSPEAEAGTAGSGRHRLPDRPAPPARSPVAVVRTRDFAGHREAVRHAVELAGGLGFIRPGQTVLLKPAVNSAERYPATTDPETIQVVAELVRDAGGRPLVADRTMFLRSTEVVFERTGIRDAAQQAGIPVRYLEDEDSVPIRHPLAEHWPGHTIRIYRSVAEADHIINLCTPRTHALGGFTMSLKNSVGVVNGLSRLRMHVPWGLKERLAEINLVVRASLIVMDGREGFADGGPDSGDLVRPGFIAAGSDPVALDAVGLAHLRLEGANREISEGSIWTIPLLRRAVEIGLGVGGAGAIALTGVDTATEAALRAQIA